jgi:hypothetical protein
MCDLEACAGLHESYMWCGMHGRVIESFLFWLKHNHDMYVPRYVTNLSFDRFLELYKKEVVEFYLNKKETPPHFNHLVRNVTFPRRWVGGDGIR